MYLLGNVCIVRCTLYIVQCTLHNVISTTAKKYFFQYVNKLSDEQQSVGKTVAYLVLGSPLVDGMLTRNGS